jgi:hemerythrin-like metal-binding protein
VDDAMLRHIGQASVLHEIGKVGIPDRILLKDGPLGREERQLIEQHTLIGHEILLKTAVISDSPELIRLAAAVARSHHERFDGRGYPDGLAGEAIPLAARIVAVVDVFDALTGVRPYKAAWSEERAIDFICQQAGSQFDPKVVEAFLAALDARRDGAPARWTDSFSVEHAALDQDHRKLFDILNQLWSAREVGNRQIIEMALDDLMHYSLVHFGREEQHMEAIGYPGAAAHRQSHADFCQRIEAFRWEYHYGVRTDVHAELVNYLSWWLLSHIAHEDRGYHRFGRAEAGQVCLPISLGPEYSLLPS